MRHPIPCILLLATATTLAAADGDDGWHSLFDGRTLTGWQVGAHPESFRVEDGAIVANGPTAHLFYVGDVHHHDFTDFHLSAEVMTYPKANAGIYVHTRYQEDGWPTNGIECQVNNSHGDWRRTGSLWGVADIRETHVQDQVWYTQEVIVRGRHLQVRLADKTVLDHDLPAEADDGFVLPTTMTWRTHGTIALQAHDPGSKACFRNIRIRFAD